MFAYLMLISGPSGDSEICATEPQDESLRKREITIMIFHFSRDPWN